MPSKDGLTADELVKYGSSDKPTRAAAADHCTFKCSVGTTTITRSTVRESTNSVATRSAKVVLPAPGVATAMKPLGLVAKNLSSAACCQARSRPLFLEVCALTFDAGPYTSVRSRGIPASPAWPVWSPGKFPRTTQQPSCRTQQSPQSGSF